MLQIGKTPTNRRIFHVFHNGVEHKKCSTCQTWQGVDSFCKAKNWDGLHKTCNTCQSANYQKNKILKNQQRLNWQRKNKDILNTSRRLKRQSNKDAINLYFQQYHKNRKTQDAVYGFAKNVRRLIQHAYVGFGTLKNTKTKTILGLDNWNEFHKYLTSTFESNYKRSFNSQIDIVHIDHITPLSTAKSLEDVVLLNHFTNLQLLLAKDNMAKSDKLNWSLEHGS